MAMPTKKTTAWADRSSERDGAARFGDEPQRRPQVLGIAVVVREQPAHDRVADVHRQRRAQERWQLEAGRDEVEPREVR